MLRVIAIAGLVASGLGGVLTAISGPELTVPSEAKLEQQAAAWRAQGPAGLQAALEQLDELTGAPDRIDAMDQMRRCVDLTAGQRDAWMSHLYWYTDLDAAKAAAAVSGKPILSLRMLGKLTDEFSCANSRYFRTALYANAEVSATLRDNFVLHWQSVRPVPRVTIDFGDGRKLQRTVTGNSAHYILDASGQPLDVLPGLYGPRAFGNWLARSLELHTHYAACAEAAERNTLLVNYHTARRAALDRELQTDLTAAAPETFVGGQLQPSGGTESGPRAPVAAAAGAVALTKSFVEAPLVAAVTPLVDYAAKLDGEVWQRIAQLPHHVVELDQSSWFLMRREFPAAATAGARANSKRQVEVPLVALVQSFQGSIAVDAVKNEYLLHRRIHDWYVAGEAPADFDALNERVYAELFLTPSSDPWLGLAPADAFTGLDRGGLTPSRAEGSQLGAAR